MTQRLRVAGPTMVVGAGERAVWKAIPSAAGTGVQSQPGFGGPGVPARREARRGPDARVEGEGGAARRRRAVRLQRLARAEGERRDGAGRGPAGEVRAVGRLGVARAERPGAVVEEHPHGWRLGRELGARRGDVGALVKRRAAAALRRHPGGEAANRRARGPRDRSAASGPRRPRRGRGTRATG